MTTAASKKRKKSAGFEQVPLASWKEIVDGLTYAGTNWVFRGQRDAEWDLRTSLERYATVGPRQGAEGRVIEAFKRRSRQHLGSNAPASDNMLEWLALIQHHGGPTRLLDWTRSPFVALFFAIEDATDTGKSCAVWGVDEQWLHRASLEHLAHEMPAEGDEAQIEMKLHEGGAFESLIMDAAPDVVVPVEPWQQIDRVSLQQSVFLCQGNLDHSFEENLRLMAADAEKHLVKYVIPISLRPEILRRLRTQTNISRATLFPGLDGFTQSLRQLIAEEIVKW